MRSNGRPVLLASTIPATDLNVRPGETRTIVCPDCRCWRIIRDRMIFPHRTADGTTRCPGSGQRVRIDIPLATLENRLITGTAQAGTRRPTRIQLKPSAPIAPPVFRLAAR